MNQPIHDKYYHYDMYYILIYLELHCKVQTAYFAISEAYGQNIKLNLRILKFFHLWSRDHHASPIMFERELNVVMFMKVPNKGSGI